MRCAKIVCAGLGLIALAGCGNADSSHLVFGQRIIVGLTISASAPEQGAELSLGYKDHNIAVIPVAIKKEDGTYQPLGSYNDAPANVAPASDAYSTLGQFEMNTGEDGTVSVGLGKFFATGIAAQTLADGFKESMKQSSSQPGGS